MNNIKVSIENISKFVSKEEVYSQEKIVKQAIAKLHDKTGAGHDFLGWLNLPSSVTEAEINDIEETVSKLKAEVDTVIVVGIGGSYLGAKSVTEALAHTFEQMKLSDEYPSIFFAGQNIGEDYMFELMEVLKERKYAVVVISKSGTTTEPAIAFRILKKDLEERFGKETAKNRIVAVTDKEKGALRILAEQEGYKTYVIPDDVGGRFSVLSPVGLLPIALAGYNIRELIKGAAEMEKATAKEVNFKDNPAAIYAATRFSLYKKGKTNEILVNYNPKLHYLAEWWKQLFGESEGKDGKGIFPASVDFSTDLHSMGQYIQDGIRNLFETVISVSKTKHKLSIPEDEQNLDKLNYIAGKNIDEVNKKAELGTTLAHVDGGVPNIRIELAEINEYNLGQIIYFFEKACGISGYLLEVNPFDQPGVEAYKRNMFALLEKPGFEKETAEINKRLK